MTDNRKLYSIKEALAIIPMSQSGLYQACKNGTIPTVKIGKRVLIPARYIDELTALPCKEANATA
jgi:predicted DNA-binding transcriptional regulator AlpA